MRETLTLSEMAARLGVGLPCVRRMLRDGVIPAVSVGRRRIVGRVAWERWIERLGTPSPAQPQQGAVQ